MRHVQHLILAYVHGQLRPARRARVMNHVRVCDTCRAALAHEERLALDLQREMPLIGQPNNGQLTRMWAGVWQEISLNPPQSRVRRTPFLPGLSAVLAILLVMLVALPLVAHSGTRAEAAPMRADNRYISPTPGSTEEVDATLQASQPQLPQATVAFAMEAAPVPKTPASPVAPRELSETW